MRHSSLAYLPCALAVLLGSLLTSGCRSLTGDAAEPWRVGAQTVTHTSLSVGRRSTDVDSVVGDSDQVVGGLEVDWFDPRATLGYEAGFVYGSEDDVDFHEGYAGLRRTWVRHGFTPYAGAGLSFISVDPDDPAVMDLESFGGYGHVGVYYPLSSQLFSFAGPVILGLDLRLVSGEHVEFTEARLFLGFGAL